MDRKTVMAIACITVLGLGACDEATRQQAGTGAAAGVIGAVAAQALGASDAWTVVAAGAAATAGALYARNRQTNQCAYHTGDGDTVTVRGCPT